MSSTGSRDFGALFRTNASHGLNPTLRGLQICFYQSLYHRSYIVVFQERATSNKLAKGRSFWRAFLFRFFSTG